MKKNLLLKYIVIVISVALVAIIGGIFTNMGMEWYENLLKPSQWPPKFLFPLVWSLVYVFSIIILVMLVKNKNYHTKKLVLIFIINGILNVLWCLLFFVFHQLFLGQVIIIINLIMSFMLINKLEDAGNFYFYLLSIYPIWLSIATTLNLAVWILN